MFGRFASGPTRAGVNRSQTLRFQCLVFSGNKLLFISLGGPWLPQSENR